MSWGELSCKYCFEDKKPCKPEQNTCNIYCSFYVNKDTISNTDKPSIDCYKCNNKRWSISSGFCINCCADLRKQHRSLK